MGKKILLVSVGLVMLFVNNVVAQEDIEKLYMRKAVKNYVAKNYDKAISNLDQVLVANPKNTKAKKLLSKCHANKGIHFLEQQNMLGAEQSFESALKHDPTNQMAVTGKNEIAKFKQKYPAGVPQQAAANQGTQPQGQAQGAQTNVPQVIVNSPAANVDTNQTKIISALVNNLNKQQKLFGDQIRASNSALERTEDTKEKYLDALVNSSEKSNSLMRNFFVIGGAITLGIFFVFFLVFFVIFRSVSKASDLRTVEANETLKLLLQSPQAAAGGDNEPLMITGPQQAQDNDKDKMDSLNTEDPVQRANAVEAVAAEIIDSKESSRMEKIKKLEELLNDENNRVRANAAKAIYEIDKEMSLKTLKDMLDNSSKRMRASAVWALGEIASEEALGCVLEIKDEDDEIVKYNIKVALGKIKSHKRFELTEEHKQKIESALEAFKDLV